MAGDESGLGIIHLEAQDTQLRRRVQPGVQLVNPDN